MRFPFVGIVLAFALAVDSSPTPQDIFHQASILQSAVICLIAQQIYTSASILGLNSLPPFTCNSLPTTSTSNVPTSIIISSTSTIAVISSTATKFIATPISGDILLVSSQIPSVTRPITASSPVSSTINSTSTSTSGISSQFTFSSTTRSFSATVTSSTSFNSSSTLISSSYSISASSTSSAVASTNTTTSCPGITKELSQAWHSFDEGSNFNSITTLSTSALDLPSSPDIIARRFKSLKLYRVKFADYKPKLKNSQKLVVPNREKKEEKDNMEIETTGDGGLAAVPRWHLWTEGIDNW